MNPLEKYMQIKNEMQGKECDEHALSQYLRIAQVMSREEEAYKRNRREMLRLLAMIEKRIYDSAR